MTGTISPLDMNDLWGRGWVFWHRPECQWEPCFRLRGVSISLGPFQASLKTLNRGSPAQIQGGTMEGLSLCSSSRYHLGISVRHNDWKQTNTDRISHPSLGYENHKDAGMQTTPLPSPWPHTTPHPPLVADLLSLPTSNWLIPDPHGYFIFWAHKATWDRLICVGKRQPCCLHLLRLPEAPPFLPFPLCSTLLCFNSSRKEVKVASIHPEHIQKRRPESFLVPFPSNSCPVAYFNSKWQSYLFSELQNVRTRKG